MKGKIYKTSNPFNEKEIEINTLDDLMELIKKEGAIIVAINKDGQLDLELYDTYRE